MTRTRFKVQPAQSVPLHDIVLRSASNRFLPQKRRSALKTVKRECAYGSYLFGGAIFCDCGVNGTSLEPVGMSAAVDGVCGKHDYRNATAPNISRVSSSRRKRNQYSELAELVAAKELIFFSPDLPRSVLRSFIAYYNERVAQCLCSRQHAIASRWCTALH